MGFSLPDFHCVKQSDCQYFCCQNIAAGFDFHGSDLNGLLLSVKGYYNGKFPPIFQQLQVRKPLFYAH